MMIKKTALYIIYIALVYLPTSVYAGLQWENTTLDFQAELGDKKLSGTYKFTNTGKEDVVIDYVKAACGCTTTSLTKKVYAPGESGEIEATFTVGKKVGKQHKLITVVCNNGVERYTLSINANIPQLLKIHPYALLWKKGDPLTSKKIDVKVMINDPVNITLISNSADFVSKVETIEKGKHYTITVTPVSTAGIYRGNLTLKATYPKNTVTQVKLYAYVR